METNRASSLEDVVALSLAAVVSANKKTPARNVVEVPAYCKQKNAGGELQELPSGPLYRITNYLSF